MLEAVSRSQREQDLRTTPDSVLSFNLEQASFSAFMPDLRLEKWHNCTVQDMQGCRGLWGQNPLKSFLLEQS